MDAFLPESIQIKDNQQREVLQTQTTKNMNTHLYPYTGFVGQRDFADGEGWLWIPFGVNFGADFGNNFGLEFGVDSVPNWRRFRRQFPWRVWRRIRH